MKKLGILLLSAVLLCSCHRFTTKKSTGAYQFNLDNCNDSSSLPAGFSQYNISGAQKWACTTYGTNNTNAIEINGYSGQAVQNEDWLILPSLNLSNYNYPILTFDSRTKFSGPAIQLLISTDYSGSSNPSSANWKTIRANLPAENSDSWLSSDSINLADYKNRKVYIAIKYSSSPTAGAARWTLDNINIVNAARPPAPSIKASPSTINFGYIARGQTSPAQKANFYAAGIKAALTLTAPAGFLISKDSIHFNNSISFSPSEINSSAAKTYIKFAPDSNDKNYKGQLTFSSGNFSDKALMLYGTSLSTDKTLEVVNWNLDWFADNIEPSLGPKDKQLQIKNVETIMKQLKADIYALAEVVDTASLGKVVRSLPGHYNYIVSPYGSYADNPADTDYAGTQKLAFVYNTDVINDMGTYGVLRSTYHPGNISTSAAGTPYKNWASGRFPFFLKAKVKLNGKTIPVDFIIIHAKANTGSTQEKIEAYNRREGAAEELKDSLDAQYPNADFIMLGDFNDDLDKTITTQANTTVSSYEPILAEKNNYYPVTLLLSQAGQHSDVFYDQMIDHVIISNEMQPYYINGSAMVRSDLAAKIADYGNTTTDHYPVETRYYFK